MRVQLDIPGADAMGRVFLTWTPVQATARLANPVGTASVRVTLSVARRSTGGRLFFATRRTHKGRRELTLKLPASGKPVRFFVAGEFGFPSRNLGDVAIVARVFGTRPVIGKKPCTVRVRKNAESLTPAERDRFLAALATFNGGGAGRFTDIRDMHVLIADDEEHGNVGFLPWHRAYLLDLERELQAIDPSVALPYWRFDLPAPKLFTLQFIGVPDTAGRLQFTAGHPLGTWRTDGVLGITRSPGFGSVAPFLLNEADTIDLGGAAPGASYGGFASMEGNPHGLAHTSFSLGGFIRSKQTAARDPLFFMLHANVDRLWAKWQWVNRRTSPADPLAFASAVPNRIGHRLPDTMWPWNGVTVPPRPPTAPGGAFPSSPSTTAPGSAPTVGSMLDYQGAAGGPPLGFAYDDVPFEV